MSKGAQMINYNTYTTNLSNMNRNPGPNHLLRTGYSKNVYDVNSLEFHKIIFVEKSKGTFFGLIISKPYI